MRINEGTIDRAIRGVVGIILLAVGLFVVRGPIGIVLDVIGAVLLVTSIVGFCPLYTLFGLNTSKKA